MCQHFTEMSIFSTHFCQFFIKYCNIFWKCWKNIPSLPTFFKNISTFYGNVDSFSFLSTFFKNVWRSFLSSTYAHPRSTDVQAWAWRRPPPLANGTGQTEDAGRRRARGVVSSHAGEACRAAGELAPERRAATAQPCRPPASSGRHGGRRLWQPAEENTVLSPKPIHFGH
jgi:hypothetical protein